MVVLTKKEYKISFWDVGNIPYLDLDCDIMCVVHVCVCIHIQRDGYIDRYGIFIDMYAKDQCAS